MKPKFHFFSDAEHRKQCKRAGCKHPAIYNMTEFKAQGWSDLCRALVFGPKQKKGEPPKQTKDEPIEFQNPFDKARRTYMKPPGSRPRWP